MKRLQIIVVLFLFSICSCTEHSNVEQPINVKQNEVKKQENLKIPSSYYCDIDTISFSENNMCYFRSKKKEQRSIFESKLRGGLTHAFFLKEDTLKIKILVETIEDDMGQLKTDTLICFYKVYPDSLVPMLPKNITPIKGNKIYLRHSGTYKRITSISK